MKQILLLIIILAAIFFLWQYPFLYPLKLLIVFFHESSHALMTVFTGGQVKELVINHMQGGHVISLGGNRFIILSAGYLGSLIWGSSIYLMAVRSLWDKAIMSSLGILILAITGFFVRDFFALVFCVLTGIIMIILGNKANMQINDIILRVIGVTSMMYVPLDIYSDTIQRLHLRSDAFMLAEEFGGATWGWGSLWILISLIIIVYVIKMGLKQPKMET